MPTKSFSVDYLGYVWNVTEPEHYTKWFWSTSFSGFLRFLPGSHPLWDFFKGASGGSVFWDPGFGYKAHGFSCSAVFSWPMSYSHNLTITYYWELDAVAERMLKQFDAYMSDN